MKRFRCLLRWIGDRLKDAFYSTDNLGLDLARVLVTLAVSGELAGEYHNVRLHQPLDLGPNGFGGGMAAILTAGAAYLVAKAWSKKKARESAAIAQNTAVAVEAGEPVATTKP